MRTSTGLQKDLFDRDGAANGAALIAIPAGTGPVNPAQRSFNRLIERIRRGRERLAAWEALIARIPGRVIAELQPIEQEIRACQRRLLALLQPVLAGQGRAKDERLSRRHRRAARTLLLEIIDDLLEDGPDPELEALHDRYSDVSLAEASRQDLELAEILFGEVFGGDITQGHKASNVEELMEHTAGRLAEEAQARAEAARGHRSARAVNAAARKAQSEHEATQSVREIYRKLASALHPDRETDPAERERKTRLLQRANQAYARDDLLELLALQVEVEQIDASALANLPEARLRRYNQVLLEQARTLEAQVLERAAVFAMDFGMEPRDATPADAERAFDATIIEARAKGKEIARLADRLAQPQQRRAALEELALQGEQDALDELTELEALFGGPRPRAATGERKRRRKRRKR